MPRCQALKQVSRCIVGLCTSECTPLQREHLALWCRHAVHSTHQQGCHTVCCQSQSALLWPVGFCYHECQVEDRCNIWGPNGPSKSAQERLTTQTFSWHAWYRDVRLGGGLEATVTRRTFFDVVDLKTNPFPGQEYASVFMHHSWYLTTNLIRQAWRVWRNSTKLATVLVSILKCTC